MDNSQLSKTILAKEYTLQDILGNKKYSVDYFQREYKWGKENIDQLINDLTGAFMDNYRPGHKTSDVANYNTYYLGSVVLGQEGSVQSIIDGQQRITSLTLFLIYLNHLSGKKMVKQLDDMIYSDSFGEMSFNLQVPEREKCLEGLYNNQDFDASSTKDESVQNMVDRYHDFEELFPKETFKDELLRSFIYWLKDKVIMVVIKAMSKENAYTIFETINNRGVPLTSSDMLKGYILSKFKYDKDRESFNKQWKTDMLDLKAYGADVENQFFQAWLRSQYAVTIRQSAAGSVNQDFENIGSRFHNWFKDNYDKGVLSEAINGDVEGFMDREYKFYLRNFLLIKKASIYFSKELEHVYYNACYGISPNLSYALYLAPLQTSDTHEVCVQKMDMVAKALDGFVTRRGVNFKLFSQSSIRYTMCNLVKSIRGKSLDELKTTLVSELEKDYKFDALRRFYLHQQNGRFIKYFLSRLTSFIEEQSGQGNKFVDYFWNPGSKPQEIEHIWSDHPEWHTDDCPDNDSFYNVRNSIGDLVLLPNGVNQSYSDMPSEDKIQLYKENLLAMALNDKAYTNNPSFIHFIKASNLPFKSYTSWKKADIEDHCKLYQALAEIIWSSDLN